MQSKIGNTKSLRNLVNLAERPLSYSSLKQFARSPLHYIKYLTEPYKKTPALILGGAIDVKILTPEKYDERYIVAPKIDRRTKAGKAEWELLLDAAEGKTILTEDQGNIVEKVSETIENSELAQELLSRIEKKQTRLRWEESGLPMIGYLDGLGDIIFELKTAADASPDQFQRDAFKFGYHIQGGAYTNAVAKTSGKFPDLYYLVVETSEPYGMSIFKADAEYIKCGKIEFERLVNQFRYCYDNDLFHQSYEFWGSVLTGHHMLDLPGYAKSKILQ